VLEGWTPEEARNRDRQASSGGKPSSGSGGRGGERSERGERERGRGGSERRR